MADTLRHLLRAIGLFLGVILGLGLIIIGWWDWAQYCYAAHHPIIYWLPYAIPVSYFGLKAAWKLTSKREQRNG